MEFYQSDICTICKQKFARNAMFELFNPQDHKSCFLPITPPQIKQLLTDKDNVKQLLTDKDNVKQLLTKIYPISNLQIKLGLIKSDYTYDGLFRKAWINHYYSWHLPPTYPQLQQIKQFIADKPALEVGAGKGLFAALLQAMDINIIATDPHCDKIFNGYGGFSCHVEKNLQSSANFTYLPMEILDISQSLQKYGTTIDTLISCWGNYNIDQDDLQYFTGNKVIIIGEEDGCTGCGYLQHLCEQQFGWKLVDIIRIPIFHGLWDHCYLYIRNE